MMLSVPAGDATRDAVETERVADAPANDMVGTGGIAAHADAAYALLGRGTEPNPPPKTFTPPIFSPTIGSLAVPKVPGPPA